MMQKWLPIEVYQQRKKEIECDKSLSDFERMQKIFELENLKDFEVNDNVREAGDELNYLRDDSPLSFSEKIILALITPCLFMYCIVVGMCLLAWKMIKTLLSAPYNIIVIAFLVLFLGFAMSGCATKKELVYVPTKCEVEVPKAPIYTKGKSEDKSVVEILQYTEKLEKIVKFCTGVEK